MPYDYPGDYAGRFDGIDPARSFFFKSIAGQPRWLQPLAPGTLLLEGVVAATPYGSLLLDQWLRAPRASAPRNIVIETLDYGGVVIGHWKLNAAFPEQAPVRRMGEDRLMTSIVSFEVTHRGLLRN